MCLSKRATSRNDSGPKTRVRGIVSALRGQEGGGGKGGPRLTFGHAALLGNPPGETRDPDVRIHCRRHVTSNQPGIVPDVAESVGGVGECSCTQAPELTARAASNSSGLLVITRRQISSSLAPARK